MNNKNLQEIIELVDKTLATIDNIIADTKVEAMTKTSYITIGGVLDSIKILAQDNLGHYDKERDNIDRAEAHSISGTMNNPSAMQKEAFKEDNK